MRNLNCGLVVCGFCCPLCAESVEAGRPVLFFCKAGKDRTGLVAAMILTLMGASE
jgi:protein tyrosine/serine phosphatase